MFNRVYKGSLLEAEIEVLSSEIGGLAEKNRGSTNTFLIILKPTHCFPLMDLKGFPNFIPLNFAEFQ